MSDLKPCPFCGGEAHNPEGETSGSNMCHVVCSCCGAEGPWVFSADKAIDAWNTRPKSEAEELLEWEAKWERWLDALPMDAVLELEQITDALRAAREASDE